MRTKLTIAAFGVLMFIATAVTISKQGPIWQDDGNPIPTCGPKGCSGNGN